jgi:putative metalloprotease
MCFHEFLDHVKKKIRLAYASGPVRKAIASQRNEAGEIARSVPTVARKGNYE